jgi:hypothetical protein
MGRTEMTRWTVAACASAALALTACSDDPATGNPNVPPGMNNLPSTSSGAGGSTLLPQAGGTAGDMATGRGGTMALPPATGGMSGAAGGTPPATDAGASGAGTAGDMGTAGAMPTPGTPFTGPLDGDPAKPMVMVPNVPCGAPNVSFAGAPPGNMVKITNRDVFVAYPCAHEGAAVTFYLAIHGTLGDGQKIPFTLTNFPVHSKVDTDNFIVVAPQAIGMQWGNGDNGMDLPHLYEVIDWVYATFGEKFKIRGMWASGGSWGSIYLYTLACDPKLENRLTGIRMIVGRGCPPCASRLSCIVGEQELEEGGGMVLSDAQKEMKVMAANIEPYAKMHGCDARTGPTNIGPVRAWDWPGCDPGWAHSYYLAPGQHADRWDDPAYVTHMVAQMKATDR